MFSNPFKQVWFAVSCAAQPLPDPVKLKATRAFRAINAPADAGRNSDCFILSMVVFQLPVKLARPGAITCYRPTLAPRSVIPPAVPQQSMTSATSLSTCGPHKQVFFGLPLLYTIMCIRFSAPHHHIQRPTHVPPNPTPQ